MTVLQSETTPLQTEADIVRVRHAVRQWAIAQGFSLIDQTKLVTATSELARNTVVYGGEGRSSSTPSRGGAGGACGSSSWIRGRGFLISRRR